MPVFVSFYTDAFYMREAFELARTLRNFPLDYVIREVATVGDWNQNTNLKPKFILEMAQLFPERGVCWVDADARVRKFPAVFGGMKCPIAYHTWRGRGGAEVLSGTVFFGPGKGREGILHKWVSIVEQRPRSLDQVCLAITVREMGLDAVDLPVEYTWIYDMAQGTDEPNPRDERPVIEQMQASRWAKRLKGL